MHKVGNDIFPFKACTLVEGDELNSRLHRNERYGIDDRSKVGDFRCVCNLGDFFPVRRIDCAVGFKEKRKALEPVALPFDGVGMLVSSGHIIMKHAVKRGGI